MIWRLLLIPATWAIAAALVPWASRYDWALPLVLFVGCSGSIAALVIP